MTENLKDDLKAEALKLKVEKLRHEVSSAATEAHHKALELQALERKEADLQADPDEHRIYSFLDSVNASSVEDCMEDLGVWARRDIGKPITIIFNSPGGAVIDGLALYDFIDDLKEKGVQVTTIARGMAASMGGVLLQAGNKRIVGKNAHVLIHEVSKGSIGKVSEIEDDIKFAKKLQERLVDILAERSTMTTNQIKNKWKRKDWWLGADECVKFGFADEIG